MEVNKKDYYSIGDITRHIKSFLRYLRTKLWLLLLTCLFGAGLAVTYYFIQKPKYEAVTTFILEEKSSGAGGLAGLASQFGINVGSLSGGGSIFAGDNILDILKSKKVVQQVLISRVDSSISDCTTLVDLYLAFKGIKESWKEHPTLSAISFAKERGKMSPVQDSILNVIYETIIKKDLFTERTSKQGTIIKVQVNAENSLFARLMTERLVEEASKLYLNIRTGTAEANINRMQRRSDSLLALLNNKSYTVAASQPLDINPGIKTAIVPVEIASRDKTVIGTLYTEVTRNLEASKLLLSQQTPVIQILDKPGMLMDDNKKGLFFLIVVFSIISVIIYLAFASITYLLRAIKDK